MDKLTDAEIIKALECCIAKSGKGCSNCPYHHYYEECRTKRNNDCIDLINRQKSEIERLQKAIKVQDIMIEQQDYKIKSKSEAVKEFAERLKKLDVNTRMLYSSVVYELGEDDIDNLVKEMTENITKVEHDSLCETETYKAMKERF